MCSYYEIQVTYMENISFVNIQINLCCSHMENKAFSFFHPSLWRFVQVAKFPFEEVPVSKQGAKQVLCQSSPVPTSAHAAPGSTTVLDTEAKTGKSFDSIDTYAVVVIYL